MKTILVALLMTVALPAYAVEDSHSHQEGKGHTAHGQGHGYGHHKGDPGGEAPNPPDDPAPPGETPEPPSGGDPEPPDGGTETPEPPQTNWPGIEHPPFVIGGGRDAGVVDKDSCSWFPFINRCDR